MKRIPKWMSLALAQGALAAMGFMEDDEVRRNLKEDREIVNETLEVCRDLLQECREYLLASGWDTPGSADLLKGIEKLLFHEKATETEVT